jgi:hypothetical protein
MEIPVISAYTRKQAIEDGIQREITDIAKEEGFKYRTFITQNCWMKAIQVPEGVVGQDERGRLHDVFWMLHCAIKRMRGNDSIIKFVVHVRYGNAEKALDKVTLLSQCGAVDIDDPTPSLTIMLPEDY